MGMTVPRLHKRYKKIRNPVPPSAVGMMSGGKARSGAKRIAPPTCAGSGVARQNLGHRDEMRQLAAALINRHPRQPRKHPAIHRTRAHERLHRNLGLIWRRDRPRRPTRRHRNPSTRPRFRRGKPRIHRGIAVGFIRVGRPCRTKPQHRPVFVGQMIRDCLQALMRPPDRITRRQRIGGKGDRLFGGFASQQRLQKGRAGFIDRARRHVFGNLRDLLEQLDRIGAAHIGSRCGIVLRFGV